MSKPLIACVIGTRPDTIKMAPVIAELQRFPNLVRTLVISTGQHREMLTQALQAFNLSADIDLNIMTHGQSLAQITSRALEGIDKALSEHQPAYVIAQGDTTTTFCASLAAFYRQIKFGHVEAGLRTDSINNPFPEEMNRRACALVADLHFPPTPEADANLERENIPASQRIITGNTGIDAILHVTQESSNQWYPEHTGRVILLTTHRRENWGDIQTGIAQAALKLVQAFPDTLLVVPMHLNPTVRTTLKAVLENQPRVNLIEPPDYADFAKLMKRAHLILTDSGGVQEEAPTFGVPVLVLRETTERPEGVAAGAAKLVGTNPEAIFNEAKNLLENPDAYAKMSNKPNPYGDGKAAERIRFAVLNRLGITSPEVGA